MLRRLTAFEVELSLSPVTKLLGAAWSQALPWLLDFGLRAAPRLERGAWECCELAYGPRRALRQLALAFVLQSAIVAIQLWRRTRREPKKESGPMHSLATAETYDAWQDAASQLDQGDGGEAWRAAGGHGEALVDARSLRAAAAALRECISDSLHAAMYRMRGDLLLPRDAHGMGSSRLFDRARMGAPLVVDAYVAAAVSALAFVSETDDESVPLDARLAFFNECRHAHGRTALLLSGGAGLGTYHLGVVAALIDAGALPRVISGASAGSIVAATVCARTDAELEGIYDAMLVADEGVAAGEAPSFLGNNKPPRFGARVIFRFDFFRWRSLTSLRDAVAPGAEARSGGFGVGKGKKTLREHAAGGLMCGDHLASVIQANVGDVTFQEAFDRTGRILNIPVKQHDESGDVSHIVGFAPPRLLNYLTAPHVLVWSASRASCAVPGIYKPSPLLVRAADGSVEFEGPTVYVDGSMGADLPMETMRTLFNCNHFICSQTNPHAAVLGDLALQLVGAVVPCSAREEEPRRKTNLCTRTRKPCHGAATGDLIICRHRDL